MPKKRNKPGTRRVEKRLFIVCEGAKDKSESAYFKAFIKHCKFSGQKVEVNVIDTRKNTGKELVREAKKCREFNFDTAWVVYDKDGYTKHPETFDYAKQHNIRIGFSSISFEYWILLHFEYTSRPFVKSDDVIKYLNDKNYLTYSKCDKNFFGVIQDLLPNAIKNAINIQKHQIESNPDGTPVYNYNPYTNLNELIEAIQDLQSKL